MDAQRLNREMDGLLPSTGVVDEEIFLQLADAHSYDAASTVGWVEAKLLVLHARLSRGKSLELYVPSLGRTTSITSADSFAQWARQHFPSASLQSAGAQPNNSFKPKPLR